MCTNTCCVHSPSFPLLLPPSSPPLLPSSSSFQEHYCWTGICVEPFRETYELTVANRGRGSRVRRRTWHCLTFVFSFFSFFSFFFPPSLLLLRTSGANLIESMFSPCSLLALSFLSLFSLFSLFQSFLSLQSVFSPPFPLSLPPIRCTKGPCVRTGKLWSTFVWCRPTDTRGSAPGLDSQRPWCDTRERKGDREKERKRENGCVCVCVCERGVRVRVRVCLQSSTDVHKVTFRHNHRH